MLAYGREDGTSMRGCSETLRSSNNATKNTIRSILRGYGLPTPFLVGVSRMSSEMFHEIRAEIREQNNLGAPS